MIAQATATGSNRFGGYRLIEDRILHSIGSKHSQISCGRIMTWAIQAVGIYKMGVGKAEAMCLIVHQFRKAFHSTTAIDS